MKVSLEELKFVKKVHELCCPICDNDKCVSGTEKCEAVQWIINHKEGEAENE